jgi:hypothetical protein
MEFPALKRADWLGVASFVQSREEDFDVVRVRQSVVGHRLDQLFNQVVQRDLSSVGNVFGALINGVVNFENYLFHTLKLTAKSERVKVRGIGRMVWPIEGIKLTR